jgi:DNA-binding PadR family transcriptional regulator
MPPSTGSTRFLPLGPLDLQVLTLLAERPLHGYGVVQAASEVFPDQPSLGIGSLYRVIGRLLDQGLIREAAAPVDEPDDRRVRRYYQATALGRRVGRAEAERLRALLRSPVMLRLLEVDR